MIEALIQIWKDDRGMESVEVALSIALIAAIAGFGMVVLGTGLSTFYSDTGSQVGPYAMPQQPPQN